MRHVIRGVICLGALVAMVGLAPGSARAALLSDLLNGDTLIVGDQVFYNFSGFSVTTSGGAHGVLASEISVRADVGDLGLLFQSARWNVQSGQTLAVQISYDVRSLDPLLGIDGGSSRLLAYSASGGASITLDKTISDTRGSVLGEIGVVNGSGASGALELSRAYGAVHITDVLTLKGNRGRASISAFRQRYTEGPMVPEPTSVALMGTGLLFGSAVLRRRRGIGENRVDGREPASH